MSAPASTTSYWAGLARTYSLLTQPLKPSPEDIRFMERALRAVPTEGSLRALLLGVTPALPSMRWPEPHSLVAVDASLPMVQAVWPNYRPAVCGDWERLPFAAGSYEVVIGDGSANCVRYPEGYRSLARAASAVLSEQGILILRCYS